MLKDLLLKKSVIPLLSKGLDVYALRQKVIANNIANVDTPGYQRREVLFEEQLQSAIKKTIQGVQTNEKHIPVGTTDIETAQPQLFVDSSGDNVSGVNNVDIEKEIVEEVKNEIRYLYAARLLNRNFAFLRASIKGRFDQ